MPSKSPRRDLRQVRRSAHRSRHGACASVLTRDLGREAGAGRDLGGPPRDEARLMITRERRPRAYGGTGRSRQNGNSTVRARIVHGSAGVQGAEGRRVHVSAAAERAVIGRVPRADIADQDAFGVLGAAHLSDEEKGRGVGDDLTLCGNTSAAHPCGGPNSIGSRTVDDVWHWRGSR